MRHALLVDRQPRPPCSIAAGCWCPSPFCSCIQIFRLREPVRHRARAGLYHSSLIDVRLPRTKLCSIILTLLPPPRLQLSTQIFMPPIPVARPGYCSLPLSLPIGSCYPSFSAIRALDLDPSYSRLWLSWPAVCMCDKADIETAALPPDGPPAPLTRGASVDTSCKM